MKGKTVIVGRRSELTERKRAVAILLGLVIVTLPIWATTIGSLLIHWLSTR